MKLYIGIDDTDNRDADRGTGKLARWFEDALPVGCTISGVVRQQLLVDNDIPYTSHNSSACVIVDMQDHILMDIIIERAIEHVKKYSLEGSDPGVCVASATDESIDQLIAFGLSCTSQVVTQSDAICATSCIGLVNRITAPEDLMDRAMELAQKIAPMPFFSIPMLKHSIDAAMNSTLAETLQRATTFQALCYTTNDLREGIDSTLGKRAPHFSDEY